MPWREGFAIAGAWRVESEKNVACYPPEGGSTRMGAERRQVGGESLDLAAWLRAGAADLPLYAIGRVAEDDDGRAVLKACHQLEVDTFQLPALPGAATACTEIMISEENGSRTHFYFAGVNATLAPHDFDFHHCLARWLHLGELHGLAQMLQGDPEFGTGAGRVLQSAREAGLTTSLALTRRAGRAHGNVETKIFSHVDYLLVREAALTGHLPASDSARRIWWEQVAEEFFVQGICRGVVIYSTEAGLYCLRGQGKRWCEFPAGEISPRAPGLARHQPGTKICADFLYAQYQQNISQSEAGHPDDH